jgi:hypothetical protein
MVAGRPDKGVALSIVGVAILFLRGVTAIGSFLSGAISILKKKERSIAVFFATLIGLFFVLFFAGEILFPH